LQFAKKTAEFKGLAQPERLDRDLYRCIYNIILILASTSVFRFFLIIMPLNFNLFLIKNFKKLMGYKPNARDRVLQYNEKSNV